MTSHRLDQRFVLLTPWSLEHIIREIDVRAIRCDDILDQCTRAVTKTFRPLKFIGILLEQNSAENFFACRDVRAVCFVFSNKQVRGHFIDDHPVKVGVSGD